MNITSFATYLARVSADLFFTEKKSGQSQRAAAQDKNKQELEFIAKRLQLGLRSCSRGGA